MSSKKLTALIAQIPDDFVPLFGLTVCFGIWLVLNLSAETRVLERFFRCMFSDLERPHSMLEVFVSGLVMNSPQLFLKLLELTHKTLEFILLRLAQFSHFVCPPSVAN